VIGDPRGAVVSVAIGDGRLSRDVVAAVTSALEAARSSLASAIAPALPVVRLRTRRRLEALGPEALVGAVAILAVTERGARRLPDLVEAVRAARPLGVQLVWDGEVPRREVVERHVFSVLERARQTPGGPPVVLARTAEPAEALRILIANRQRKDGTRS
jgi:hypothetical protein